MRINSIAGLGCLALLLVACGDSDDLIRSVEPLPEPVPLPDLATTVTLASGDIEGQEDPETEVWEWLGVPYAEAPVDELRWRAPVSPNAWSTVLETKEFAPACPQFNFFGEYVGDEDCLYLNLWRPRTQERGLPVFLWIHGGGNSSEGADWEIYDGGNLADRANMVVINFRYRLGPLGWLYYPPLQDGNEDDNSGNFGTLDIIRSLEWVQENIEAFGGDPGNVTIAGQSAGGFNVISMLSSERASGLFQAAIVQSGFPVFTKPADGQLAAERLVNELVQFIGAPAFQSPTDEELAIFLRGASAEQIIRATPSMPSIFTEGQVIPQAGADLLESGEYPNKVPIMVGTNRDEYKLYTNPFGYNVLPDASPELREVVGRTISDIWRVRGADQFATTLRAHADQPDLYVYRFNWGSPDADGNSPLPPPFGATGGAIHGAELAFMFGNWDTFLIGAYKDLLFPEDSAESRQTMADIMVNYWGSFAWQGDPNGGNYATWSPWTNAAGGYKAITLDVNYADNQALIGEDHEVWTIDSVMADFDARVMEPLRSEALAIISSWFGND